MRIRRLLFTGYIIIAGLQLLLPSCNNKPEPGTAAARVQIHDTSGQKATLDQILSFLPPDRVELGGPVSFLDSTIQQWLKRTGEPAPDFENMPPLPFLPDPMVLDEGGKNIPVRTMKQWNEKRDWMKKQVEHYLTGTCPPKPDNLKYEILSEKKDGQTTLRMILLTFGPENRAKITFELMLPPGNGPFPVLITQWNHREWAQIAVRRGYAACVYAGADTKDDTEEYSEIWAGQYDFTRLMRRAYGASRVIDYLYTLPFIDKNKIGITGHSRNGDVAYLAAAFDERITAAVPSSAPGMEIPWRYSSPKYDVEDVASEASNFPSWYHPRLRLFTGRENRLPVDNNILIALIAPRGLMMSMAINEGAGNPWASEQVYFNALPVYKFLGEENNLVIRLRNGLHSISARDMEDYMDFFDYIFKRSDYRPGNRLVFNYSFEKWKNLSGEKINPKSFEIKDNDDILSFQKKEISSLSEWENKKKNIQKNIQWALGDEPSGVTNPGPGRFTKGGAGEIGFGTFLIRPRAVPGMGVMTINPYNGFGDQLFGYLYYPADDNGNLKSDTLPVVIWLHEYDYSKGFNSYHQVESLLKSMVDKGYAVFSFDMVGFGNRIEEGTRFYERYPHWSKMGKMVADVRGAVDALVNLEFINKERIYVAGYSLGATVGLYSAATDERIAGAVSVAGFTPMRTGTPDKGVEGIKTFSHLHGLLPRLGFFIGNEDRIPYDFDEVLSCIAPRPVLVIAPLLDKDAVHREVENSVEQAGKIYGLYNRRDDIRIFSPDDYNIFSPVMREKVYEWLDDQQKKP
jgi:dienelactone hydrolase